MVKKTRFIEPGNISPYKKSIFNYLVYNKNIRNPSTGLITLATIVKKIVDDTLMYSESISEINFEDVYGSDIVFISINTFNAVRGYELAKKIREKSGAIIVLGGMHASLNYPEAIEYCDYVLTGDGDESIVEFISAISNKTAVDFPGVVFKKDGKIVNTGKRHQPENIDTIPDRNLVYDYSRLAKKYDTLWAQVHASRGCTHNCAYCTVIEHFGQKIRKRTPENVAADIKEAIAFHKRKIIPRLNDVLWLTDDNFAQDREWAMAVSKEIIKNKIKASFSVQARFEIGFDDELLDVMKKAGFFELTLGVEFLDDDTFRQYRKKSKYAEILQSIKNIQAHGMGVRGLFMVGADRDTKGIGNKIADFVIENDITGVLIQSMFFTPGTAFYRENKDKLIHENWDKYNGSVVHYPKNITAYDLQKEIIQATAKIYSLKRLRHAMLNYRGIRRVLFFGEFFWHMNMRNELRKDLPYLRSLGNQQRIFEDVGAPCSL